MIRKILFVAILSGLCLCLTVPIGIYLYNQTPPAPEPKWEHSANAIILRMDRFHGEVDCDYMPPLQISGNGQALRVYFKNGERQILEVNFSERELEKLIDDFIQAGFFDDDTRFDSLPMEGDYAMLSLKNDVTHAILLDSNQTVKRLVEQLVSTVEERGQNYSPHEGVIEIYQLDHNLDANVDVQAWPDEEFGYTLREILNERKVLRGEELLFAWEIRNSANLVVESDGEFFWFCITQWN